MGRQIEREREGERGLLVLVFINSKNTTRKNGGCPENKARPTTGHEGPEGEKEV